MATGTVKWFNTTKGYGFIQPDDGGADVFVHISAVEKAGRTTLPEGARVSYELVSKGGGKTPAAFDRDTPHGAANTVSKLFEVGAMRPQLSGWGLLLESPTKKRSSESP